MERGLPVESDPLVARLWWALIVIGAIPQVAVHLGTRFAADNFWDLFVYLRATDSVAPYRSDVDFLFIYPPIALDFFKTAGTHFFEAFLTCYVASIAWLVSEYSRLELDRKGVLLLAALGFGGLGVASLRSGNVTVILHALLLAAVFRLARRKHGFGAVVAIAALAALVKPYFAIYCLLGVIGAPDRARAITRVIVAWLAIVLVFAAYWQLRNTEMRDFLAALSLQTLQRGDIGGGLFAVVRAYGGSDALALGAHLAGWLALLLVTVWCARQLAASPAAELITLCLAYFVLALANPRAQPYDLFPAVLCLLVAGTLACPGYIWPLGVAVGLGLNAVRPAIEHFTAQPGAYPAFASNPSLLQFAGILILFGTLMAGIGHSRRVSTTAVVR